MLIMQHAYAFGIVFGMVLTYIADAASFQNITAKEPDIPNEFGV